MVGVAEIIHASANVVIGRIVVVIADASDRIGGIDHARRGVTEETGNSVASAVEARGSGRPRGKRTR